MAEQRKKDVAKKAKEGELVEATPAQALSPWEEMEHMFERFDRMFDDFFPARWRRGMGWGRPMLAREAWAPRVDIVDRDDDILVRAELPGVDRDDVDVSISDNMLTIKGETRREKKEEKGDYFRSEISRGTFSRTLSLPSGVDVDKVKAKFKDGLLELTLPKVEKAKRRSIKVD